MNIGTVTPAANGELLGHLAIMSFDARIGLKPVASSNERAPKFEVVALNVARRWVRIGALWEKEARESGEVYLAGHLGDPSLPDRLYIAGFRQEGGGYALAWTRGGPSVARSDGTAETPGGEEPGEVPPAGGESPPRRRARRASEVDDPFA